MLRFYLLFALLPLSILTDSQQYPCGSRPRHRHQRESPPSAQPIIGGRPVERAWGWMVSLTYSSNHTHFCGGSIISSSWILTAAHCVSDRNPSDILIYAGSTSRQSSTQRKGILRIISHPNYNSESFANDIALIELLSPLDMNDPNIARICLPPRTVSTQDQMDDSASASEYPPVNSQLVAIGWGKTAEYLTVLPVELQEVILDAIAHESESCNILASKSEQFCAGVEDGHRDTCAGDSGGPLMILSTNNQWIVAGITSTGYGCAIPGNAGIYTRVASYRDWIRNFTGIHYWVGFHGVIIREEPDRTIIPSRSTINICSRYSQFPPFLIMTLAYLSVYFTRDNLH